MGVFKMLKRNYIVFGFLTAALTIAPLTAQAQQAGGSNLGKILEVTPGILQGVNSLIHPGQNNPPSPQPNSQPTPSTSSTPVAQQDQQQNNSQNSTTPNNSQFCGASAQLQASVQNLNPVAVASDISSSITNLVQGKQPNQLNTSGNIGCSK
jgi:hypothetical protein